MMDISQRTDVSGAYRDIDMTDVRPSEYSACRIPHWNRNALTIRQRIAGLPAVRCPPRTSSEYVGIPRAALRIGTDCFVAGAGSGSTDDTGIAQLLQNQMSVHSAAASDSGSASQPIDSPAGSDSGSSRGRKRAASTALAPEGAKRFHTVSRKRKERLDWKNADGLMPPPKVKKQDKAKPIPASRS